MKHLIITLLLSVSLLADEFWTPYEVPSNRPFASIAKAPDGTFYTVGFGIWSSEDEEQWTGRNTISYMGTELSFDGMGILMSDVFISSAGTLFLLPEDGILFRSADKGLTWSFDPEAESEVSALGEAFGKIFQIADNSLLSSEDEGLTWTEIYDYSGLPEGSASDYRIEAADGLLWFNGKSHLFTYGGEGTPSQVDFSPLASEAGVDKLMVKSFDISGDKIMVLTDSVLISGTIGEGGSIAWTWQKMGPADYENLRGHYDILYTSTHELLIAGRTGTYTLMPGIDNIFVPVPLFPHVTTWGLAEIDGKVYSCGTNGIYELDPVSPGSVYNRYSSNIGSGIYSQMFDANGDRFMVAPNAVMKKSGDTWTDLSDKLPTFEGAVIYAGEKGGVLRTRNSSVYAAGPSYENWNLLYESDGSGMFVGGLTETGNTFIETAGNKVVMVNIAEDLPPVITEGYGVFMVDGNTVVLNSSADAGKISFDGGATWMDKENIQTYMTDFGYTGPGEIRYNNGSFYALTSERTLIRSDNDLESWDSLYSVPKGPGENELDLYIIDDALYVAGDMGILRSVDGGTNWEDITFETKNVGRSFIMKKMSDGKIYASLFNGVFSTAQVPQDVDEEPAQAPGISLYPQPADALLNVDFAGADIRNINVYDLSGKKVKEMGNLSGGRFRIDTGELSSGLYFMHAVTASEEKITGTFIKK